MEIFTVSFFGHREIKNFCEIEQKVRKLIRRLLTEKEYVEFLVGRDGAFDQMASSAVRREKCLLRADNSALTWVLPYPTADLRDNWESYEAYYDEIEICHDSVDQFPKGAFQIRNRKMVDRSDLVVFYVERNKGGAYQTMCYAIGEEKNIINLAREK